MDVRGIYTIVFPGSQVIIKDIIWVFKAVKINNK